jgi:UDP-N-acetylglucosamine 2-epimerase
VLVYGDTNSTLAGALAAAQARIPVAHVEAGMRSFDRAMPEEVNRVVADCLSGLLLCPTPAAMDNLAAEGRSEASRMVGDVMADIAFTFGPIADKRSDVLERLGLEPGGYIAATAHRAGNVDDPANLERLVGVLGQAAKEAPVVFPVHPRTRARLDAAGLLEGLADAGVTAIEPLGYLDMTKLTRNARAVITDSGGLQKEAYLAKVPCVTMRETTEWVETVDQGWNRLVGLDADAAAAALTELIERRRSEEPDTTIYGAGDAGEKVSAEIASWLGQ